MESQLVENVLRWYYLPLFLVLRCLWTQSLLQAVGHVCFIVEVQSVIKIISVSIIQLYCIWYIFDFIIMPIPRSFLPLALHVWPKI